ncbi:enoyl-CoA hydratase/carnithine racemase [Acinetobacter calcoaceticus]|uniref:3-hydroxyisobutyryl-CoA hydrolase n=1 Tax=Acinetobacter calcoaceticus TaxID=471 RepID=A0A4R1XLR5_ACICA|nr:enoyl-CoA hydratase/carnithine racemase [Acinetobacter calcoaceticus]
MQTENNLVITTQGDFGIMTLDRAGSLNALSLPMIQGITQQLKAWQADDAVHAVLINSNSPKAFCAGGDIRYLYDSYKNGDVGYQGYFAAEYLMLNTIRSFEKPVVVLLDGYVLGGGFGLAQACHIRVTTEKSRFSMPETAIGYFPDVGATYILSRLGAVGCFMALSGEQISSSDAVYLALVDAHVSSARLAELTDALLAAPQPTKAAITDILSTFASEATESELKAKAASISNHFSYPKLEQIEHSLANETDPAHQAWAQKILGILQQRSLLAKQASLRLQQIGAQLSLAQCMQLERDMQDIWFEHGDLIEGVRALLIDKDKQPKWQTQNAQLEQILDDLFAQVTEVVSA